MKEHQNRNIVKNSWNSIATALNSTPELCKTNWKNLRDSFNQYNRSLQGKSGDACNKKRKWIYYDQMSFLKNYAYTRPTVSNITTSSTLDNNKCNDLDQVASQINSETGDTVSNTSNNFSVDTSCNLSFTNSILPDKSNVSLVSTSKRKKNTEQTEFQQLISILSKEDDELDTFGQLVAKKLRKMTEESKELCMLEINNSLFKYRSKNDAQCNEYSADKSNHLRPKSADEPAYGMYTAMLYDGQGACSSSFGEIHYEDNCS